MKKYFFLFIFLTFGCNSVFSQKKPKINIDSLYQVEKLKPHSKEKVDQLIFLYKKSIKQGEIRKDILDDALIISEKIFYIKGLGVSYNRKGITARYEHKYGQSVIYHKRAINYLEKTTDTFHLSKCLNSLGVTYRKLNQEKEAFEYYLKALKLSNLIGDNTGKAISLNGIGNVLLNTEQYKNALDYFKQALKVEIEQKNPRGQEYGYANIGEVFLAQKNFDSAYYYFDKSLQFAIKYPRKESIAIKHTLFGELYQKQGKYKKSNKEYEKAFPKLKEYKNKRYISKALINVGINELKLKQFNNAIKYINEGLELGKKINSKENTALGYAALVEYYSLTKNYEKALNAHVKAKIYHDSIVNVSSQRSMINTQVEYETEEKDIKIHQLAKEKEMSEKKAASNFNRFIISAVIGLVSVTLILILFYLYRRNSDLELQQKNGEIQNYILKISKLKDNNTQTEKDTSYKFKEFQLSNREIEVLTHISNGLNNEEISEKMFISKNTIKSHITHIYSKLDVKNRIQAIQKINR